MVLFFRLIVQDYSFVKKKSRKKLKRSRERKIKTNQLCKRKICASHYHGVNHTFVLMQNNAVLKEQSTNKNLTTLDSFF